MKVTFEGGPLDVYLILDRTGSMGEDCAYAHGSTAPVSSKACFATYALPNYLIDVSPAVDTRLAFHLMSQSGLEQREILLDFALTGASLINNYQALGIDPARANALILSHGHNDHYGALPALDHGPRFASVHGSRAGRGTHRR